MVYLTKFVIVQPELILKTTIYIVTLISLSYIYIYIYIYTNKSINKKLAIESIDYNCIFFKEINNARYFLVQKAYKDNLPSFLVAAPGGFIYQWVSMFLLFDPGS